MKTVPLARLEDAIVKPGIEKHLIPLLHFKGHANLGAWHRKWNLVVSAHEHECETLGEIIKLQLNPEYSQLCLPEKRTNHPTMHSMLSRILLKPELGNLRPGLLDYVRFLLPRGPWQLQSVSEYYTDSHSKRMAWWRSLHPDILRERRERVKRREERRAAKLAEKLALREARVRYRAARRDLILRQREEARVVRAQRRADKAAEAARRRAINAQPRALHYPFLIHDGGRAEHKLLRLINDAVPRDIMGDLRADICQDLAVGILCGDVSEDDLRLPVKEIIAKMRKAFPSKWGPMSLDAPIPGADDLRLIDTI